MKTVRAYSGDRYFEFVKRNGSKPRPDEFVKTMRETGFVLAKPVQNAATLEQEMLTKAINMCKTAAGEYDKQALVRMLGFIYNTDDVNRRRSDLPSIRMTLFTQWTFFFNTYSTATATIIVAPAFSPSLMEFSFWKRVTVRVQLGQMLPPHKLTFLGWPTLRYMFSLVPLRSLFGQHLIL